ncbi:energy transducer TonB [Luteimonas fraxinea]|uniref:Energy transducer TonB n=1 Tax=Luteimonas fraxinea TaxID=2901869 RepID=A0ABS8U940_9GAMM|nr:energy transducer TonB [Luteimonas fraxinea]MCD9095497.1 energy transducer TonB [Luteimonas fraxinea]MCD9126262.1 energy transducer TonB [Luteimonas fraxinea]UHH11300.1 energy transducer TonB [Luteimonas fraxinea]
MHRLLFAALAVAFLGSASPAADAQTARQAREELEASMLVTGYVDIGLDGQVTDLEIDEVESLPPYVIALMERAAPTLRFEPVLVDGVPALARAKMSARLVAASSGKGGVEMRIASAHFGERDLKNDSSVIRLLRRSPPRYPEDAVRMGGQGTVYLLVKVGRDGKTQDAHAEQVNLTAFGTAQQMERVRALLTEAAVDQARRRWTWTPPSTGASADHDYWVVRVPVDFFLGNSREPRYGQWASYHPGEMSHPAWAAPTAPGFRPDAIASGGAATPETSRFKLMTPFEG